MSESKSPIDAATHEGLKPIFVLDEKTQVDTIYFIEGFPGMDFLGMVYKSSEEEGWVAKARFRYYQSDAEGYNMDPDAPDEKRVYTIKPPEDEPNDTPDNVRRVIEEAARGMAAFMKSDAIGSQVKLWEVPINGNGVEAAKFLQHAPWAHVRVVAKETPSVQ